MLKNSKKVLRRIFGINSFVSFFFRRKAIFRISLKINSRRNEQENSEGDNEQHKDSAKILSKIFEISLSLSFLVFLL